MAHGKETGPVGRLAVWLLKKREPEDDGFPEPLGDEAVIITFRETPCLVLYGYFAMVLSLFALWMAYRSLHQWLLRRRASATTGDNGSSGCLREPLLRQRKPEKPPAAPLVQQSIVDSQGRMVKFEGYADNTFGTLVAALMPLTSFVFLGLFCLFCLDYYSGCEWSFPEQLCYIGNFPIFGTFETNSKLFLLFWTTSTAWFGLLIWNRGGRMTNLFRFQVPLAKAQYVQVTVEEKREALSSGHSRILALQAWFTGKLVSLLHLRNLPGGLFSLSGSVSQTVPLEVPAKKDGPPFVQFRCVRYSLDVETGAFKQYEANTALSGGHQSFLDVLDAGGLPVGQQSLELKRSGDTCPPVHKILLRSGPNEIPFAVDSWRAALLEEFSTFFFLYQFSIYAVCLWFSYWHYTIIACGIAILSGFMNVRVKLKNQASIKAMMQQTSTVTVRRGGKLQDVDSRDVVPGDILKVTGNKWVVPCDLLILKGAAVVDESTITGESMPVQRLAPTETITGVLPPQRFAVKHVLVAGTMVLQVADDDTWAVATHTGISTQKGQLLLLILYPPKLLFKYDEQLGVAFCLLLAYGCALVVFIMRMMYVRYASAQRIPLTASWGSSIFAVSCVLPTMLHIVLSVGQVVAAERLKGPEYNIFCVAPKRIALGGKVRVACFDKTGTLTTSSLEFFGVHQVQPTDVANVGPSDGGPFSGWVASAASGAAGTFEDAPCKAQWGPSVLCGLACTHSLSPFAGNEAGVVGNAVEVNMFQASGWTLVTAGEVRSPVKGEGIEILRRFDFSHTTMTMSAVVKHSPSGQRGVYCKGSFEQVSKKCLPSSLPPDFMARAQAHSYSGMYVLALAARPLAAAEDLTKMTREESERGLVMLGFLLFKNPLRSDTKDTIEKLRAGEVRSVMITGDAAGTAVCIAKEASLVTPGVPVLLGDIRGKGAGAVVLWRCGEEDLTTLNELQLSNEWLQWRKNYKQWRAGETKGARGEATSKQLRDALPSDAMLRRGSWPSFDAQLAAPSEQDAVSSASPDDYTFTTEELVLSRLFEWCELAVTQNAWEWLQERECSPDLRRVLLGSRMSTLKKGKALSSGKGSSTLAWELLTLIRIFARMTPGGKISVVEGLMSQGLICSMCGDGGNDSGALRTAHVGMALSNATSATVVAPFTTNRPSVAPIVDLLREGRGALATSFAGYKFCVHYGLLNSAFKTVTYYYGISLPMTAAYFQDLGGQLSLSWAMTLSKPSPSLIGDRPTSSLFSVYLLSSLLGMWLINCFFIFYGMRIVTHHEGYVPFPVHLVKITQWWKLNRNWESNALFFLYTFQLFWSAVVFSFGHFFRLAWYQNMTLLLLWGGGFGFILLLLLGPANALTRAFHLVWEPEWEHEPWSWQNPCPAVPGSLKRQLLVVALVNGLVVSLWEKVIVQGGLGERVRARCSGLSKHITLRL